MTALIAYYRLWLLLAFLVGLATAWWTWGQTPRPDDRGGKDDGGDSRDDDGDAPGPENQDREPPEDADTPEAPREPAPPEPVAAATQAALAADDFTRIKGIDPHLAELLRLLGVSRYSEMAGWADNEAEQIAVLLGTKPARIAEDRWIEQARLLAEEGAAGQANRLDHG